MTKHSHETEAETENAHLMAGEQITVDELAVALSAIELRLRQLARAAETPSVPVELADTIDSLRGHASDIRALSGRMAFLSRVLQGDVPMRLRLPSGDGWGAAAVGTDREDFGGPAIIPTQWQIIRLAEEGQRDAEAGRETTTYPEGMKEIPRSITLSWESKAAAARRRRERDAAVAQEVLLLPCSRCEPNSKGNCVTANGWPAERAHAARQRKAEARVDEQLGYMGDNPVAVPDA